MAEVRVRLVVAVDHPSLAGHFPGKPVVPAVLLLELVRKALRSQLGEVRIDGVPMAKFLAPLLPQEEFTLVLDSDAVRGQCIFRCETADGVAARGEISFRVVPGCEAGV